MDEPSNAVLAERIGNVQASLQMMNSTLGRMSAQLDQVPLISQRLQHVSDMQENQAEEMGNLQQRVDDIEVEMPGLKELRKWVIAGIIGALGMLGASIVTLVVPARQTDHSALAAAIVSAIKAVEEHK